MSVVGFICDKARLLGKLLRRIVPLFASSLNMLFQLELGSGWDHLFNWLFVELGGFNLLEFGRHLVLIGLQVVVFNKVIFNGLTTQGDSVASGVELFLDSHQVSLGDV